MSRCNCPANGHYAGCVNDPFANGWYTKAMVEYDKANFGWVCATCRKLITPWSHGCVCHPSKTIPSDTTKDK